MVSVRRKKERVFTSNIKKGKGCIDNIGSTVGKPKDGNQKGCYVLLTLDENSSSGSKESIEVEFVRFAYDVEKAATAFEASFLPDEFAVQLRKPIKI